jgi:hypothetical protein
MSSSRGPQGSAQTVDARTAQAEAPGRGPEGIEATRPYGGAARYLAIAIVGLGAYAIASFLYVALSRLFYPGEINFIEGVMMDHAIRLANGHSIYVEPSLEFVPLAYMPGYSMVASILVQAFGPALWELRAISLAGSIATAILVAVALYKETRRPLLAFAGSSLFLMGLGLAGGHYDVGRPDLMTLALVMAGVLTLRWTSTPAGAVGSAVLLTAAFFTKQHAVWFAAAALLHIAVNDRRRFAAFGLALLAGIGGGYALLTWSLGPWFPFYTWDVPSHWSTFSEWRVHRYVGTNLFGTLAPLTLATIAAFLLTTERLRGASALWKWLAFAALGTGFMATLDPSAYRHLILPTFLVLTILGPLSIDALVRRAAASTPAFARHAACLGLVVLAVQYLPLLYSLDDQIPKLGSRSAHARLLERIHDTPGPILVPYHGYLASQAGRRMGLHHLALTDVLRAKGNRLERQDPLFFDRMFDVLRQGPNRPTLILDVPLDKAGPHWKDLTKSYKLVEDLAETTTGELLIVPGPHMNSSARFVYVPVEPGAAASAPASRASTVNER